MRFFLLMEATVDEIALFARLGRPFNGSKSELTRARTQNKTANKKQKYHKY